MTHPLDDLQAALARWRSVDLSRHVPRDVAIDVITCAERLVDTPADALAERDTWHQLLDETRRSPFLRALADNASRSGCG